jgi:hypothetical protein
MSPLFDAAPPLDVVPVSFFGGQPTRARDSTAMKDTETNLRMSPSPKSARILQQCVLHEPRRGV